MVYTPEQVSDLKDRLLSRGYIPARVSWMMARPVPGWDGWRLASEFEAEHGLNEYNVETCRDPEGRLIKRFAQ